MSLDGMLFHRCGAPNLLVLLPGALMTPRHMVQAGLFAAVREGGLALDLTIPDLHAQGVCNNAALDQLQAEILAPARHQYQQVWLGGISRGGQLALSCLAEKDCRMDGICLLAPYAGSRLTINAIRRAGGVDAWQPKAEELQDPEFRLWQWLKRPDFKGPIFMGYGEQDRFADGMQLLAKCLPAASHYTLPGGHDWPVWQKLWAHFLELGYFPRLP